MTFVFNASPVIVLAKAGLLDVVSQVGDSALIPQAVVDEILRVDDPQDPARTWFEGSGLPFQRVPNPSIPPFLAAWDLGAGESAVIAVASSIPETMAVLDDLAGRRCAQAHGIPIIGTLGLILLFKKCGAIPTASPAIAAVMNAGLFVSESTLAEIRAKSGE